MPTQFCPNVQCRQTGSGDAKIIRHGFFRSRCGRRRRYRCLECGRTFSNRLNSAYFRLRCSSIRFDRVAMFSVEGLSRSAIARVEGISWNTADRWVSRASEYASQFNQHMIKEVELVELQADELKTFTSRKASPTWIFTGIEVNSRLWLSTVVGRRSYRNTLTLFNNILSRGEIGAKPLITTDGFTFYQRVIRKLFGVYCIYAQMIKTWRKDRVIKVERRVLIGTTYQLEKALSESEDSETINTSFVERLNLTLRQSVAALARKSPSHPRCSQRLQKHLELAQCYYNFIRRHASLVFGREQRTPAMVAGLTNRALGFHDVFRLTHNNT